MDVLLNKADIWDKMPHEKGAVKLQSLLPMTVAEFDKQYPNASRNNNMICEPWRYERVQALENGTFVFAWVSDDKLNPERWT